MRSVMRLSANATRATRLTSLLLDVGLVQFLETCGSFFQVSSPLLISFDGRYHQGVAN